MTPPSILERPAAIRRVTEAERPGLVLDFDGTLSEIIPVGDHAVIHPRNASALRRASEKFPLVAVLSGRRVDEVVDRVDIPHVVYIGNHGSEYIADGVYSVAAGAVLKADAIASTLDHLKRAVSVAGLYYQDKRFSASAHFRNAADPDKARRQLEAALVSAPNMDEIESSWGRMILDLRPISALNKGDAVTALVSDHSLDAVMFVGDDTTDLDAMRALSSLTSIAAVSVAVLSDETPPPLIAAADFTVRSVEEVADLLDLMAKTRAHTE